MTRVDLTTGLDDDRLRRLADAAKNHPRSATRAEERSMATEILAARALLLRLKLQLGWKPCGGCGELTDLALSSPRFSPGPCCEKCARIELQAFADRQEGLER